MYSRFLIAFAALLAALALCASVAAQNPNLPPVPPGPVNESVIPPPPTGPVPVLEYSLAFIATAGVLVLVCYPARRN
jgi:hypothetical protein